MKYITKGQSTGLIIFTTMLFTVFILPDLLKIFTKPAVIIMVHSNYNEQVLPKEKKIKDKRAEIKDPQKAPIAYSNYSSKPNKVVYETFKFNFDPNTCSGEDIVKLGFRKYIAERILKYRKKGGYFKKAADLYKIYGIDSALIAELKDGGYIQISKPLTNVHSQSETEKEITTIEINSATAEELQSINGIGAYRAEKIIKFRETLGGFASISQVSECYAIPDSTYNKIFSSLTCNPALITPVDLNSVTVKELSRHPYINWKQAEQIINFLKMHPEISTISELSVLPLISQKDITKLSPYYTLDKAVVMEEE